MHAESPALVSRSPELAMEPQIAAVPQQLAQKTRPQRGDKQYGRSRMTNQPSKVGLDGRSALGRRIRDLAESYAARLGGWSGLSDTLAANIRKAAELVALAEHARRQPRRCLAATAVLQPSLREDCVKAEADRFAAGGSNSDISRPSPSLTSRPS
jgi:hypothetical protein